VEVLAIKQFTNQQIQKLSEKRNFLWILPENGLKNHQFFKQKCFDSHFSIQMEFQKKSIK
jgi:hypothetical protein